MPRDAIERRRRGELPPRSKPGMGRPFATIPSSILGSVAIRRLSGQALRVFLLANAAWTPKRRAVLPIGHIANFLSIRKSGVGQALQDLQTAGLITLREPAIRPGAMGSATPGRAAVFAVLGREAGTTLHRVVTGDRRLAGAFRADCLTLRKLAAMMTNAEARILVGIAWPCHRDRNGAPQGECRVSLSGRICADQLSGMSARTADAAIAGLVKKGLLGQVTPAAGSRAGVFEPCGLAASVVPRRRRSAAAAKQAWILHEAPILRANPAESVAKPAEFRGGDPGREVVARKTGTVNGTLCAKPEPGEKLPATQRHQQPLQFAA